MGSDKKTMFAVPRLKRETVIDIMSYETNLSLSWADGMVGVIPVFATYDAAKKWDPETEPLEVREVCNG